MKKILIIDDDAAILDVMKLILELENFQVIPSLDGGIIAKIKSIKPDVVLLDIWLGGEDGRDIARNLKKDSRTQFIPIIMISASKDMEASAKAAGADDFIPKPFAIDDLIDKVKKVTAEVG